MYLSETMYTEKVQKSSKKGNQRTETCCYTLKDGGYLVVTRVQEEVEKEYGKDYKTISETAYASTECPELETKDEALDKLKQFAESLSKQYR